MDEISKFKFDLNRCRGTCQKALQFESSHFSFKLKNLVCFCNFLENAIFFLISIKIACSVHFKNFLHF